MFFFSEDKAMLILFYETYINKKLSDCLVGVFGVDSEKVYLVKMCHRFDGLPFICKI